MYQRYSVPLVFSEFLLFSTRTVQCTQELAKLQNCTIGVSRYQRIKVQWEEGACRPKEQGRPIDRDRRGILLCTVKRQRSSVSSMLDSHYPVVHTWSIVAWRWNARIPKSPLQKFCANNVVN